MEQHEHASGEGEVTPDTEAIANLNAAIDTTNAEFVKAINDELGRDLAEQPVKPNRAERRSSVRQMKRLLIDPKTTGVKRLHHPLIKNHLMPWGIKQIAKRRAAEKVAKRARQVNAGNGRHRGASPAGAPRTPKRVVAS